MDTVTTLALARIGGGAGALAAPELWLKAAMVDATAPQWRALVRIVGVRDIALGALTLAVSLEHRPALVQLGMLSDVADAVGALLALRAGAVNPPTGVALAGAAAGAAAAGAVALRHKDH